MDVLSIAPSMPNYEQAQVAFGESANLNKAQMNQDRNAAELASDAPQLDPELDELGYKAFAKQLAKGVASMLPAEGMVLGIYAPWGSGKSTALNYIEYYLEKEEEATRPVVVRFNPWWFSGDEALTRHFFDQLEASLDRKLHSVSEKLKGKIGNFADSVSKLPLGKVIGFGNVNVKDVSESLATMLKEKPKDVVGLKAEIDEVLREQSRTILVVIDDIDRLTPEEIRQLFRLIKAVADFPNVAYLLAFDKGVVATALSGQAGIDGTAYLEKIVQVPFELPTPDREGLHRMLFRKLDLILATAHPDDFDANYWSNVFFDGVQGFIKTPRDVVRLANSLAVTYAAIAEEVNAVDFIAIETIRVFAPSLYDDIRRNEDRFTQSSSRNNVEEDRAFYVSCLDRVDDTKRGYAEKLLARIFPRTGERGLGNDWLPRWRRTRRICVSDVFPAYFRLGLPDAAIRNKEIKEIFSVLDDQEALEAIFITYAQRKGTDNAPRIRALFNHLEDYTEETIPLQSIPSLIAAMFDAGDQLEEADGQRQGMFDLGVHIQLGRLFWQLMRRLPRNERFALIEKGCSNGKSLATIVSRVVVLGQEQGRSGQSRPDPEEQWLVSAEQLTELQTIALARIRQRASDFAFVGQYNLPTVLYWWVQWGGNENEVREWVSSAIDLDASAIVFLTHFLGETMSQAVGERFVTRHSTLSPKLLADYVDTDIFAKRMRGVDLTQLSEKPRMAVQQFLKEYDSENEKLSL